MQSQEPPSRRFVAAALFGSSLLCLGCGQPPDRINVVIVLIDQLRKDAADAWMPQLNALAEQGLRFDDMRSAAPWTYPSVISLMTGLYPQQHGADGDLMGNRLSSFDPELPLLPGLLRAAGYRTAAFVANPFLQRFNSFHEHFDSYDISFVNDLGNLRVPGSLWGTPRMFADSVGSAIFAHFDAKPLGAPEFTYVHYIDVHGPWDGAPFPPDYRAAVGFIDGKVTELYHYFMDRYRGRVLFLVTSDHGRAFDEDVGDPKHPFRFNKKSMHDFNLRIPFAILPSAFVREPRRIDVPCSNVDVAPTLLDWLGIEPAAPVAGVSLMPVIRGERPDVSDRAIYARNDAFGLWTDAMVWRDHKYIRYFEPDGTVAFKRIFDLDADPEETRGLRGGWRAAGPILAELAGKQGTEYEAHYGEFADPELVEQLQALGYMRTE